MSMTCPGCQRGLPATPEGFHRTETELFGCTRARHRLELEPKAVDTWYGGKAKVNVPFSCGGGS